MDIIHAAAELKPGPRKVCVAIGFFDGVHLGHQQVIRQTLTDAAQHGAISVVITFDQHPNTIVAPSRVPPLIYPLAKKLEVLASIGPDAAWLIHFDKAFSQVPAEGFIRELVRDFSQLQSICVGSTFSFGHKQKGNLALLKSLGAELGFTVHGLANVSLDDQPISSTRIRETIRSGDLDLASQMLGRAYSLCGRVIEGDRIGRTLGFPTANLEVAGLVLPPHGVYAVQALVRGEIYQAVLNIGSRPTLNSPAPRLQVEAHLLDFQQDIYGEPIELRFVQKLRPEQRFASLADLQQQIQRDIAAARQAF